MARAFHNAVFFVGPNQDKINLFAKAVLALCTTHSAEKFEFCDGSEISTLAELLDCYSTRTTFFISGAPCRRDHLSFLDEFSRKAIVHLDLSTAITGTDPDEIKEMAEEDERRRLAVSTVLHRVRGTTILPITGQESRAHRLHRIFRGLRDIQRSPVHPAIAEKILTESRYKPAVLASALATV